MAYYRKLASGRWRAELRDPGGKRFGRTFDSKAMARAWAADEEIKLRQGRFVDPKTARQPFGEYAARWLDNRIVEASTSATDVSRMRNHVYPKWKDWPLERISTSAVQQWVTGLSRKGLGAWTVRASYNLLSAALDAARMDGLILANPCRGVNLPRKPEGRRIYLTRDEVDLVADAMMRRPVGEFDQAVLYTSVLTGMRWGEVAGLTLPRVDLMRQRIEVVETVIEVNGRFQRKLYPKSGRRRTVPIPDPLVPILSEHIGRYPPEADELGELIFRPRVLDYLWGRGAALSRHHWPRGVFRPAVKAALGRDDVHVHDLRHTYASWLVQSGVTLYEVQRLLGHRDASSTARYAHLADDDFSRPMEALARDVRRTLGANFGNVPR